MKSKFPWFVDPDTHRRSVSLTNLMIATGFLLIAATLDLLGKVKDTSIAIEYFTASAALYYGRKFNIKGKASSDVPAEEEDKG